MAVSPTSAQDYVPARAPDRVLAAGRYAIMLLLFTVSPFVLLMFNWQYFDTGGGPLDKLHPATWLAAGVLCWMCLQRGNPLTGSVELLGRNLDVLPLILASLMMVLYAGMVLKTPVTIFLETYIGAVLVFMVYRDLDAHSGRNLALLLHALLFANALIGTYEVATGTRLTPLVLNGEEMIEETRATALLGHPLVNAIIAGAYVVMLAVGGGRDLPPWMRLAALSVAIASLVPFGGRAATAVSLLMLALIAARSFVHVLRGATVDLRLLIAALIALPMIAGGLYTAYEFGALDTLLDRLVEDDGSANARIEMFELFKHLNLSDLLYGPDPAVLTTWVRLHNLEFGIESFIVAFVLNYGIICTLIFMPALLLFFAALIRHARSGALIAVIYFLLVCLTSNSISSKSTTLAMFVLMLTVFLRPLPAGTTAETSLGA